MRKVPTALYHEGYANGNSTAPVDVMADNAALDVLVSKLAALDDADALETNRTIKRLELSLALLRRHETLGLWRAIVKYADIALSCDNTCIEAHLAKARAFEHMIPTNPKAIAKAQRAARAGCDVCDRVVAAERLREMKAELSAILSRVSALERPPKKKLPLSTSVWNVKDTWEEKDVTDWAIDRFASKLVASSPNIRRAYDFVGHAQIVLFQRKARFVFDFESIDLDLRGTGKMRLRDVTNGLGAFDFELQKPTEALRAAVFAAAAAFEHDFQALDQAAASLAANHPPSSFRRLDASDRSVGTEEAAASAKASFHDALADVRRNNPNCKITL